jgi:DNA polymerase III subunit gamma/tau
MEPIMETHNLNLARKWRSKNFDQIVGQELPVKMLKNSLFLNQFFPVYLFSGQKGCGKTSTARVFAAAINCEQLPLFQKDPKVTPLPCQACISCNALIAGKHPDFIEIDAASNTGVDNVRNIIDSSALLPLMGRKKIYLIDEAHMLSKAAFNAFLKLMEEPPASVIFILATTDTQKIIETVRSRCFQLFFKPIHEQALLRHLQEICTAEAIASDPDALAYIVKETSGSARDALNLLEQVRFSDARVTKDVVYRVLGHLDENRLLRLFEILLYKTPGELLKFSQTESLETFSAEFIWDRLCQLLRACIWIKNGVVSQQFSEYTAQLQFLIQGRSLKQISSLLELFYSNEAIFRKTTAQYPFLEVLLLRICQKNESNSNSSMPAMVATPTLSTPTELEAFEEVDDEDVEDDVPPIHDDEEGALWNQLVLKIEVLQDPLLESIFKQGRLYNYDQNAATMHVEFPKELTFFSDIIETTKAQWQPLFADTLGKKIEIQAAFTRITPASAGGAVKALEPAVQSWPVDTPPVVQAPVQKKKWQPSNFSSNQGPRMPYEPKVDVSDAHKWPQAALLLQHFPGTITQIRETV